MPDVAKGSKDLWPRSLWRILCEAAALESLQVIFVRIQLLRRFIALFTEDCCSEIGTSSVKPLQNMTGREIQNQLK